LGQRWFNGVIFLVVGLEIKRELFYGQLSRPNQVVLPFLAAIAGIICPALIYVAFNCQDGVAMNG
jgi:NhaA family Na+:H+ antiporter